MYSVPSLVACARCAASLTRCASPPESVVADCPSRRYPRPTSFSTRSRSHQLRRRGKERQRLLHRQLQHFVNVEAVVSDFQNAGLEAGALAVVADQFDVGQELHLHGDRAVALAGFAASSGNVEGKMARGVAAAVGLRRGGEQLANDVERLDIGDGIGARRAADGRLIHQDHLREQIRLLHLAARQLFGRGAPLFSSAWPANPAGPCASSAIDKSRRAPASICRSRKRR